MHPFRKHGSFLPISSNWILKCEVCFCKTIYPPPFFTLLTFPSCVVLVRERTTQIIGIACKDEDFSYMETQIMETQIFHHAKIQPSKKSSKRNQNP
jgi:hypothetical protein